MKVYEFLYCSCIYESGYSTMSVHKSKIGAYKAMRKYIETQYNKWYEDRFIFGKSDIKWGHKFGMHEDWRIGEIELLP